MYTKAGSCPRLHLLLLLVQLSLCLRGFRLFPLLYGVLHVQELVTRDQAHCLVLKGLLVQLQAFTLSLQRSDSKSGRTQRPNQSGNP